MAKAGEKMLNFDVPQELWDRFHEFFKEQGGIDKKVLGAWAIMQFIEQFDLNEAGEYRNEFTEWMEDGAATLDGPLQKDPRVVGSEGAALAAGQGSKRRTKEA